MTTPPSKPEPDVGLPKLVVDRSQSALPAAGTSLHDVLSRARYIPLVMGLMMLGAVIGLYFQPPGLRKIFEIFNLRPGGGTSNPIAVPAPSQTDRRAASNKAPPVSVNVVGLGKLLPRGDVTVVAPPFGAGDARVASLKVGEGDRVAQGDLIARLDNEAQLKSSVEGARAVVAAREASLQQTVAATAASRSEATAAWQRAQVALANANREFERVDTLFKKGISTAAATDQKRAARDEAAREVERTRATLSRFQSTGADQQPDILVAMRNLDAAKSDLSRAEGDLEKAYVRAPAAGTVLTMHVRPGEKPSAKGILNLGDIDHMMAEVEVYQTQIGLLAVGDSVTLTADALPRPLEGKVSRIGLEIGRQTVIDPSPAASTDARVVKVDVELDSDSSGLAKRFTNLQVTARITVKARP